MYKVLKHTCLAFELFAMNATPVRRVTPPWDVYMANSHPGWQGYPTWQTGQPALAGYPSYHVNVINIKWEIIWKGGLSHLLWVPTSMWTGPKFAKRARSEIRYVKFNSLHSMEWWSGGMAEYSTTRNAECGLVVWNKNLTKMELQWNEKIIYNQQANQY